MKRSRIVLWLALLSLVVGVLYGVIVLLLMIVHPPGLENLCRPIVVQGFSRSLWASSSFGQRDRYGMANDLLRTGALLDKNEAAVTGLLGPPTSVDRSGPTLRLGYDLVPQKTFPARCTLLPSFLFWNTDTWLLEVVLNNGVVRTVRIRHA